MVVKLAQALTTDAPYSPSMIACALDAHQVVAYAERLRIVERVAHPLGANELVLVLTRI